MHEWEKERRRQAKKQREFRRNLTSIAKLMSDRRMDCVLSNELANAVFSSSFVMIVSRNGLENRKRSNELVESLR